jgi:hypothetical protein
VLRDNFKRAVQPALYFARYIHNKEYPPLLNTKQDKQKIEVSYNMVAEAFEDALKSKLYELFDYSIPFERCPDQESNAICTYCDFKILCNR